MEKQPLPGQMGGDVTRSPPAAGELGLTPAATGSPDPMEVSELGP